MTKRYITKAKREEVFHKYRGHCAYCGKEITESTFEVDHIKPTWNGGSNDYDNLNPSCSRCNRFKSGMELEEYRRVYAFSRSDTPYFSRQAIEWMKTHIPILGAYTEEHEKHVFPFEEKEREW